MTSTETLTTAHEVTRKRRKANRRDLHMAMRDLSLAASGGADVEDLYAPKDSWKPEHHHDPDIARQKVSAESGKRKRRHWKTKMWKRRSAKRQERIEAFEALR